MPDGRGGGKKIYIYIYHFFYLYSLRPVETKESVNCYLNHDRQPWLAYILERKEKGKDKQTSKQKQNKTKEELTLESLDEMV